MSCEISDGILNKTSNRCREIVCSIECYPLSKQSDHMMSFLHQNGILGMRKENARQHIFPDRRRSLIQVLFSLLLMGMSALPILPYLSRQQGRPTRLNLIFDFKTMWLLDMVTQMIDAMSAESNDEVDNYVSAQYLYLIEFSGMYTRLNRNHRRLTFVQLAVYLSILIFHYISLGKAAILLIDTSLVTFGETVHFFLLIQLVIILIIFIQTKHNNIALFHRAMAKNFFNYSESNEDIKEKLVQKIRTERRILVTIPILVGLGVVAVIVLTPQLDNLGTFDFSKISSEFNLHLPLPFMVYPYNTEQGIIYYATAIFQVILASITGGSIGLGGFAYIVMSQNLWMQMEILYDSIQRIEERTKLLQSNLFGTKYKFSGDKIYDQVHFKYCYNVCLRENFRHHQVIMRNFYLWTDIFSVPIFLAYFTGTIVIALSLLSLGSWVELPGTTISSLILCACEVGYMYIFSIFSQRLTDLNEKLRFEIYSIKWYLCDEDVKTSLMIFQEVTLRPMTLVAGGMVPANMETFAKVINSSYSYYNLVTAFNIA